MTDDVFNTQTPPPAETPPVKAPNSLDALVGEGKKFKTLEDLAKGKLESDQFIETLKAENAELRAARQAVQTEFDGLRSEITELKSAQSKVDTRSQLTEDTVRDIVRRSITEEETARTVSQNVQEANSQLVSRFGSIEKAREILNAKATELGLSKDALKSIAAQSPTAFVQLIVGESRQEEPTPIVKGSVNTQALKIEQGNSGLKPGTWEYYENMRKTDPKRYGSAKIAQEMFDARKKGMILPDVDV